MNLVTSGTVVATLKWVPAVGQTPQSDPPPASLTLRETARANWCALWSGPDSCPWPAAVAAGGEAAVAAGGQADDGLGDPAVFLLGGQTPEAQSSGSHLIWVDSSSGTVRLSRALLARCPPASWVTEMVDDGDGGFYPRSYWDWCPDMADVSYSVVEDPRAVSISSAIETSYYKGALDVAHGTDRYEHVRSSNGSLSVDSAVGWQSGTDASGMPSAFSKGWQINNLPLTANAASFQSPTYAWSLSGLPITEAWLAPPRLGINNPASFSLLEQDASKFPLSCTVRVGVTDSDGTVGTNTYGITWHLPYEKNQLTSTSYTRKKHGSARVSEIYPGGTKLKMPVPAEKISLSAVLDAGAAVTKGIGDEKDAAIFEIAAKFAELAHSEYEFPGEEGDKDIANGAANTPGSGNWGYARGEMDEKYVMVGSESNIPEDIKDNPAKQAFCKMSWWVVEKDKTQSWYADGYNANGYDGNSHHVVTETHVEGLEDQAFFERYKSDDGTPLP